MNTQPDVTSRAEEAPPHSTVLLRVTDDLLMSADPPQRCSVNPDVPLTSNRGLNTVIYVNSRNLCDGIIHLMNQVI